MVPLALALPALAATAVAAVALGGSEEPASPPRAVPTQANAVARHDHKHARGGGHLAATQSNVELVSTLRLRTAPRKRISDVGVFAGYAYLGSWGGGSCEGNGVHVVDIRDPVRPRKVAFVRAPRGSAPGEGVQALRIDTASFKGDVLVTNNETCDRRYRLGGLNLHDVSRPSRPQVLVHGFGDRTAPDGSRRATAHEIHSVFAWDAGRKAYAVLVDNFGGEDVDIADISNPRRPVLVAEYDLRTRFPQILQPLAGNLGNVFHHDVVVKRVGSRFLMLVSYWDGGYVVLDVTDPRRATYVADSDFPSTDPELAAQSALREQPEGNAHEAELTRDGDFILAADEDFGPTRLEGTTADGGAFEPVTATETRRLGAGERLEGGTRYAGRACPGDETVPQPAGATFAVVVRGMCPFVEKIARVEARGYAAAIVVNNEGPEGCAALRMGATGGIAAFSVVRAAGYELFDVTGYDARACRAGASDLLPGVELGSEGDRVTLRSAFDGWGYVHLYRNGTGKLRELDTFAIPEAMNPAFARGRGVLSVHEVATSHERSDLAYVAYYAGGFRALRIENDRLVEVGRFVDAKGNNLWGVQVFRHAGREYVAASDIDFGLYVFRYTGG